MGPSVCRIHRRTDHHKPRHYFRHGWLLATTTVSSATCGSTRYSTSSPLRFLDLTIPSTANCKSEKKKWAIIIGAGDESAWVNHAVSVEDAATFGCFRCEVCALLCARCGSIALCHSRMKTSNRNARPTQCTRKQMRKL